MPIYNRIITLFQPAPVDFPYSVSGSSDNLQMRIFHYEPDPDPRIQEDPHDLWNVGLYNTSTRKFIDWSDATGNLPAGSVVRIGVREYVTSLDWPIAPTLFNQAPLFPVPVRDTEPVPAVDAVVTILSIAGTNPTQKSIWAVLENEDVGESIVNTEAGPGVAVTAAASWLCAPVDIDTSATLVDDGGNAWNIVGISRETTPRVIRINCTRTV